MMSEFASVRPPLAPQLKSQPCALPLPNFELEGTMKTNPDLFRLAFFGVLFTACDAGPLGVKTGAENTSVQPVFDAVAATQPVGPVTIQTLIDFSTFPFHGTFAVVAGSALLGCSGGTFVDHPANPANFISQSIRKLFTCTAGGTGTFTVNFMPGVGRWNALDGTGDFANLRGEGNFSVVLVGPTTGVETLTGNIHFEP
jgi:hypothetical protein